MSGTLYVVGTPIGNLGDLSPRALETLERCDFVAAEDTRVTLRLLTHFGLKKPLISYFEHNKAERGPQIAERLLQGESCALVTDAGMPAISDPGEDLVRLCREMQIPVEAVPGPVAFATALAVSGMPARRFTFEGFLPVEKKERRALLTALQREPRTMLFYEAPHKLGNTLRDLAQALGDRELAIVRELTKIHEEVIRTTLTAAAAQFDNGSLKGELVLIVAGKAPEDAPGMTPAAAVAYARELVAGGESKTNAAKLAAKESGLRKNEIYQLLIEEDPS